MGDKEQIIKLLLDSLQQGKDFVIEKAPETVQQLIAFNYVMAWVCLVACGIGLIASIVTMVWLLVGDYLEDELSCIFFGITCISTLLMGALVCANVATLLQLTLAPNVFILEWLGVV